MARMKVSRFDEALDVSTATEAELGARLERLWDQEPLLRPRPEMHDYQLTYPPAVQMEKRPGYQRAPTDAEYLSEAVGAFGAGGYYFHFGFCKYRCRYCFHYELLTKHTDDLMSRYVNALSLEMRRVRELTPGLKRALYFLGGGTPTALPLHLLERFLERLLFHFGPPMTSMSTVEAKPVTASEEKLQALVRAGFRRINLGVQTLDPELYAFHHQKEELRIAFDAIERARRVGFEFVNIDIMTGLERQTPESWRKTLAELERLATSGAVDSVFIYPYHDDPRSGTYGKPGAVPSWVQTAHSDAQARALFTRLGWKELGARFYRSPRHVRRELFELARVRVNPAYGEVLYHGLGNSSFSIGDRATFLNHRDVNDYCTAVEKGGLGIAYWRTLDDSQRATRDVTFDILYSPFTRVRSRAKKYGAETMAHHRELLARWSELGLGQENRLLGTFSLTPLGKLVHQQLIPQHYLPEDRRELAEAMELRQQAGRKYRGY
ncbi:radical SAM protein [Pyxidicoccus trucidator]|uniref:radical SAM protein n=1 Tax=Pyxidicoccus trucidator TaxID=2709662 RepID=UPI001967AEFA|nr:radical SAM protein [Pyxidicoccus trucidator]